MQINTKWFGTVEIDAAKVITFEKGLIGFETAAGLQLYMKQKIRKKNQLCGCSR